LFAAALCFGCGFVIAGLGVSLHNLWTVYLGYGVLGGIGLGLGYISPVSTLIKWFPDRPGMATGMAIMGFERLHRLAALGLADAVFLQRQARGRCGDLYQPRHHILAFHACGLGAPFAANIGL
jgi:hypothetical protein